MPNAGKRPIKVCAFDLGNTLVNDTRLATDAISDMAGWLYHQSLIPAESDFVNTYKSVNYETTKPFISHTFGETEFFEATFKQLSISTLSADEGLKKYREILMEKIHPDQQIEDAFKFIKEKGIRIALLSNESVLRVNAFMDKTNLKHYFDTIIVSEGIGIEKPDLGFFQLALERFNISGQEMVMFGDNVVADGVSKELGIFFVLVTGYKDQRWIWEKGESFEPDYTMENITQKNMASFLAMMAV